MAKAPIAFGLRRSFDRPAPATPDWGIASWRALHRMRDLPSPFEAALLRQTRDVLKQLLAVTGPGPSGRAILLLGWSSGGWRRPEIASFNVEDMYLTEFDSRGVVWLRLLGSKSTVKARTPRLVPEGAASR